MSTITAHLPHVPHTLGSRFEPISKSSRRAMLRLRRWHEGFESDRHATVCEHTLRTYSDTRFNL